MKQAQTKMQLGSTAAVLSAGSRTTEETMKSLALVWGAVLLFMVQARAQQPASVEGDKSLKIPFEYTSNRGSILLHVNINDKPALLIVDTGASHIVVRPEILGIKRSELSPSHVGPSGAGFTGDAIGREIRLQVGSREWPKARVAVMDLSQVVSGYQEKIDGLLGLDFFREFSSVTISVKEKTIVFAK